MKHRKLSVALLAVLLSFPSLVSAENGQIQSTITSDVQLRESAAQRAVSDLLENFILKPEETSIVYSEGCSGNSTDENCRFYRHVSQLGGCGDGRNLSSSKQESCLQKGLRKLYFFRDHDYLSFVQHGDILKYRIKLFYFLDGNRHVENRDGNEIHPITVKKASDGFSIVDFPLEFDPAYHYEKSKYFSNTAHLESAIEECAIAYRMEPSSEIYRSKLRQYMERYTERNTSYDIEAALENIDAGFSPFYAQGDVEERNYLRPEFNKSNVAEPVSGTLTWKGSYQKEDVSLREQSLMEGSKSREQVPLGIGGVEIMKFKFGEKKDLPDRKPRQPGDEKK